MNGIIINLAHVHIVTGHIQELNYELLFIMEDYYNQINDIEMKTVVRFHLKKRQDLTEKLIKSLYLNQ